MRERKDIIFIMVFIDKWNTIAASKEDGILNEAEIAEMCEGKQRAK